MTDEDFIQLRDEMRERHNAEVYLEATKERSKKTKEFWIQKYKRCEKNKQFLFK